MSSEAHPIADIQSSTDHRNIPITRVGIKDYQHPLLISDKTNKNQPSIGNFTMAVHLPADKKGTHMSRFIEILHEQPVSLSVLSIPALLRTIATRLHASNAYLDITFPFFMTKKAPASGTSSLMNYEVSFSGSIENNIAQTTVKVQVPVTSLCPCSKAISEYGAHNQRSHITVSAIVQEGFFLEDLIQTIEAQASCELYAILKRPDEKVVTERAFNNPKFVEDLVRDVAHSLNKLHTIVQYTVESINFESIHNHSAYAMIRSENY